MKYNIENCLKQGYKALVTAGGAYSNHIAATAAAGKEYGLQTVGLIRGEEFKDSLNPTLQKATEYGMQLVFLNRSLYREIKTTPRPDLIPTVDPFYFIPEGGSNDEGIKGCREIPGEINIPYDYICCACGTGTTLSGIIEGLPQKTTALGFSALKVDGYFEKQVSNHLKQWGLENKNNWKIINDYHFGGYAKVPEELFLFVDDFYRKTGIELDYIYTGKMMYGIYDMIRKKQFAPGSVIIAVHTGGLQGNPSIRNQHRTVKK